MRGVNAEDIIAALPSLTHGERRALARRIFELAAGAGDLHMTGTATFDNARELLQPGETGLFVHTDGRHLEFRPDGSDSTGNWVVNPARKIDRVVVVHRESREGQQFAWLFVARPDGSVRLEDGRHRIHLLDMKLAGSTDRSWKEFAAAGQNPVRYISKPVIGPAPK